MHAALIVKDEFLRQADEEFRGRRAAEWRGLYPPPGEFHRAQFRGARAKTQAAVAVHAAHMRAGNAEQCMLDGNSADVFGLLDRLLNGC